MRDALDKHYADAGKYPAALDDLVSKRYLRSIPPDPFTRSRHHLGRRAAAAASEGQGQRVRREERREGL